MSQTKLHFENEPFPLVVVGCSDALRGLSFWLGVAESLCAASLLVAAVRLVNVRSTFSSALFSDGDGAQARCVCETMHFDSFPLLVTADVGVVIVIATVVAAAVFLVLTVVVEVFVRLVVVIVEMEISVSCLFPPELAFPFTTLVVATSTVADAANPAGAAGTAADDTSLSERISLSASDDWS